MANPNPVYAERAKHSQERLTQLSARLDQLPEVSTFPDLTIFGAGSYARLEASQYSDIDLFFLRRGKRSDLTDPNTKCLRLWGSVIDLVEQMQFPKLSNDCQYLVLLHSEDMKLKLGSPTDDHENFFTARMLLLLESKCLHGLDTYSAIVAEIVSSYFKDFPDHPQTFQPIFLLNDICRFWKTMLLNYENKRNLPSGSNADLEVRKTRQKVRNFKLKFSRMTTCFASIAALGSYRAPVSEAQVVEITKLTPRERLEGIPTHVPSAASAVNDVLARYSWFLEMTSLPTAELEQHFFDKKQRGEMFRQAGEYGDTMFKLLQAIDASHHPSTLLRTLVI